MLILLSSLAGAATLTLSGSLSLAEAVDLAASGDEILVPAGTWAAQADLQGKTLRINGSAGAELSSESGLWALQTSGGTLSVSTLSFVGSGGAIQASDAAVLLDGVSFLGGRADYGAHLHLTRSHLNAQSSSFEEGVAGYDGGSIWATASELILSDCALSVNTATDDGGAIWLSSGSLLLRGTTLRINEAGGSGGAIYLSQAGAQLGDAVLDGNAVYDGYGAAVYFTESTLSGVGTQFTDNEATYGYGGAIYGDTNVSADFQDCAFTDNSAYRSAGQIGMYYADGALRLERCTVEGGTATYGHGGGLYLYVRVDTELIDTVIQGNTARYHGGGIYQYYYGSVTLDGVEISGNKAKDYSGGGLYLYYIWTGSSIEMRDVTIHDNRAELEGAGLFARYADVLDIERVDVLDNRGEGGLYGGGMFLSLGQTVALRQVQVAGNSATYGGGVYETGTSVSSQWSNVLVRENLARVGGGSCHVNSPILGVTNSSWLGNEAFDKGAAMCMFETHGEFTNVLIADNRGPAALYGEDLNSGFYSSFRYSAFGGNEGGDLGGELLPEELDESGVLVGVEPELLGWSVDGDWNNDAMALSLDSPLVDAGDPGLLDADGSRSDIGHMGGPLSPIVDADGDGWDSRYDCDDSDASVNPDATEFWYDGKDSDCSGGSDMDQDGDGVDGIEAGGGDCDDQDAAVQECADTGDTGEAGDTGGSAPGGCGGCGGGLGGGLWLMGLVGVLWRRRR